MHRRQRRTGHRGLDTPIFATQSRLGGGEGRNERKGFPQYLKCVDAHMKKSSSSS